MVWRKLIAATLMAAVATVAATDGPGTAARGNRKPTCTGSTGPDEIYADCESPGGSRPSGPVRAGIVVGPVCSWTIITPLGFFGPDFDIEAEMRGKSFTYIVHDDGAIGREWPDGTVEKGWLVACDNGTVGFRWIDASVSTEEVIAAAAQQVRARIPAPALDMNPAPEDGGYVNLGLWLAIEPTEDISVTARAGYAWATVTAHLASTDWTFGNGESRQCDDTGTPITDLDTVDEGPCGYTYRQSSADDAPYELGVTANWTVSYTSNAGTGTLAPITPNTTVTYDVDEIQTVGERG